MFYSCCAEELLVLTRIEIEGFRSIEKMSLDLSPLTVLIGPNGSGKSNFLDALALMSEGASGQLADGIARRGGFSALRFCGDSAQHMVWRATFPGEETPCGECLPTDYSINLFSVSFGFRVTSETISVGPPKGSVYANTLASRIGAEGWYLNTTGDKNRQDSKTFDDETELAISQVRDKSKYPVVFRLTNALSSIRRYSPISVSPDAPIRGPQLLRAGLQLARDGSNLASVLHSIQTLHPAVWDDVCDVVRTACPGFRRVSFPPEGGDGRIVLRWFEDPFATEHGFSANVLSDGTLRLLMLVAILLSPDPPPLVCIDEPEVGLHPDWIALVGELLQSAAERTQLIVSTHSPELVSAVKPSQVVVVEKEAGRTVANRLDDDELAHWLDRYRLGDLWRTGHIGGTGL